MGVTFYLREGVKWHNDADFTCEDARFTYEIFLTGEGLTLPYMKARLDHVDLDGLECLDDYTLKFRFKAPSAVPLLEFGRAQALIFNKEWFLAGGEDAMFLDVSVGTGPFKWSAGQEIGALDHQNFEKDPNFFLEGIPYVDELVLFGILDEGAQQAAMLAHQTDWHWVRNFGQYDAYVNHPQIMTVIRSTRSSENIWPNMRKPPFDNVKVRQAVAMGIDKAAGIAVTLDGHGSQGLGLMPPGSFWAVERADACAIPGWCQPDDMAAQRAEAINILKGENFDFNKTYILTVESDGQRVGRATFIQEQLRLLGIKTDFDLVETVAYRKQSQTGAWGDILGSTGGVSGVDDPFVGLNYYYGCATLYNFQTPGTDCDQEVEGLFQKLSETTDRAARKQIGDQIQLRVMSQYWTIPFLWEQEAVAFWPEVRGYVHYPVSNANGYRRYWHLWIDPAHQNDQGNRGQISGVPGGE
jgi:ABC-type transport system substrate-binding protein